MTKIEIEINYWKGSFDMIKLQKYNVQWNTKVAEEYVQYDTIYVKFLKFIILYMC